MTVRTPSPLPPLSSFEEEDSLDKAWAMGLCNSPLPSTSPSFFFALFTANTRLYIEFNVI
jgi:hypothetical protein